METNWDIAVIGGGPAGLTAGLYAARGGARTVLFESLFPGGQATKTNLIENYPGFDEGVEGFELASRLEKQGAQLETEVGRTWAAEELRATRAALMLHVI